MEERGMSEVIEKNEIGGRKKERKLKREIEKDLEREERDGKRNKIVVGEIKLEKGEK